MLLRFDRPNRKEEAQRLPQKGVVVRQRAPATNPGPARPEIVLLLSTHAAPAPPRKGGFAAFAFCGTAKAFLISNAGPSTAPRGEIGLRAACPGRPPSVPLLITTHKRVRSGFDVAAQLGHDELFWHLARRDLLERRLGE